MIVSRLEMRNTVASLLSKFTNVPEPEIEAAAAELEDKPEVDEAETEAPSEE